MRLTALFFLSIDIGPLDVILHVVTEAVLGLSADKGNQSPDQCLSLSKWIHENGKYLLPGCVTRSAVIDLFSVGLHPTVEGT